ncbi:hypothetical protein [Myxococcus xanthus]|uniref:hypothetical protein n=1 Tax=Myxococcus xanthus TaxID=34 RepID=UPI00112B1BDB|nr:hypothetical protein [Myxococcus xanthus]
MSERRKGFEPSPPKEREPGPLLGEQHRPGLLLVQLDANGLRFFADALQRTLCLELRGGSSPASLSDKDTEYSMNYHLELDIMDGRVILPECIPDHSTGTCL